MQAKYDKESLAEPRSSTRCGTLLDTAPCIEASGEGSGGKLGSAGWGGAYTWRLVLWI